MQLGIYPTSCIGVDKCGKCLNVCPHGALLVKDNKVAGVRRELCDTCLACLAQCPTTALKQWGRKMTVEQVMEEILRDRAFYSRSGGGVTISGGEALYQWQFTKAILECCRAEKIHTCVESALFVSPDILDEILPLTDLLITDIKLMDSEKHKTCTGVENERILDNIRRVAESGIPLVIRLPIIPGINDNDAHVTRAAGFIQSLGNGVRQVQFLRFRRLGEEKYVSLGMTYHMENVDPPREEFEARIRELVQIMSERGIPAYAGTTHKIN